MWRQAASQGGVGWKGAMEKRKGRATWPVPRAQATSFHSLSLSSSPSLFLSPLCFSFNTSPPPPSYPWPRLASAQPLAIARPTPRGRGWGEARWPVGAQRASRAGAADKRPLCQLKKRLSQDPPSPPNTGPAGLRAKESSRWITHVFSSPLLSVLQCLHGLQAICFPT